RQRTLFSPRLSLSLSLSRIRERFSLKFFGFWYLKNPRAYVTLNFEIWI
ncbi:hypothetical protein Csa_023919, partial [Cucumis sativus]